MLQSIIALTAQNPGGFILVASLIGFIYSAMFIVHPNLIFEMAPPEETSLYIGVSNTLIAPVISLGPIIGGLIVDKLGYTQLFIAVGAAALASLIVGTFLFREPRHQPRVLGREHPVAGGEAERGQAASLRRPGVRRDRLPRPRRLGRVCQRRRSQGRTIIGASTVRSAVRRAIVRRR